MSHQDRHPGTTQCHSKEQWLLWCVLQHYHPPKGLESQLAITLDLKSHKNYCVNIFKLFTSLSKNSACTEYEEDGGPQAAVVVSILPCLGARLVPVPVPISVPVPAAGVGRCSAGLCCLCSSEGKLS